MQKFSVLCLVALAAVCSASSYYGYGGKDYENDYKGYGFEPAYPPHFGSGYDKYVYGYYEGHKGPYDSYSKMYNDYYGAQKGSNYGYPSYPSYPSYGPSYGKSY